MIGLACVTASAGVLADAVADFYKGKDVELYIGYKPGGGYDGYARLIARHMGKHIPGNPNIVPKNMPGAGSVKLTNWLWEGAPQDGTAIGAVSRGVPFEPLLGNKRESFQPTSFNDRVSKQRGIFAPRPRKLVSSHGKIADLGSVGWG